MWWWLWYNLLLTCIVSLVQHSHSTTAHSHQTHLLATPTIAVSVKLQHNLPSFYEHGDITLRDLSIWPHNAFLEAFTSLCLFAKQVCNQNWYSHHTQLNNSKRSVEEIHFRKLINESYKQNKKNNKTTSSIHSSIENENIAIIPKG